MRELPKGSQAHILPPELSFFTGFAAQAYGRSSNREGLIVPCSRDEADLIARAVRNDPVAVRAIMGLCNRRLYRIARSVVKEEHEAGRCCAGGL
jgi:hypothetical protein